MLLVTSNMPRLDRDQPAEPPAEQKDRPDPQHAAAGEQRDTDPANGFAVEDPEPLPIGVGRQIRGEDADQTKGRDDPAVGPILALAAAQIAFGE